VEESKKHHFSKRTRRDGMEKRLFYKAFVYFLSVSFFFLMSGFNSLMVEAKEVVFPIGEMVSKGTVKFEARENVWKSVEPSNFPIFKGTKIKTEKGMAVMILRDNSQIEVSPGSLFFFDQDSRLILSQGSIEFRIPYTSEISFRVGNISISKSRTLEAAKTPSAVSLKSLKNEETMGTISIHSNGSVTVKSVQGNLSMVNQDRVVLAGLSSKDSVTIPSVTVGKAPRVMVAQAGLTGITSEESEGFLGIPTWGWIGVLIGSAVIAGVVIAVANRGGGGGHDYIPVCP
jgi:hypothetical protein